MHYFADKLRDLVFPLVVFVIVTAVWAMAATAPAEPDANAGRQFGPQEALYQRACQAAQSASPATRPATPVAGIDPSFH